MHIHDLKRVPKIPAPSFQSSPFTTVIKDDDQLEASFLLTRQIAYKFIAPIIISFGIIGNILTILILRKPAFRGVTYNYFLALAISDLLSLIFSISATVHLLSPATNSYSTAVWYAYFEGLFVNTAMGMSVLIVVCITIDRYFSVCRPYQFKVIHTSRYFKLSIIISLVTSSLIWIPTCFISKPEKVSDCLSFYYAEDEDPSWWVACQKVDPLTDMWYRVYAWVRETIISFIPILIVIVLNGFLLKWFMDKHRQTLHKLGNSTPTAVVSSSRKSEDNNLINLLKAIIISFLITILPAGVFNAAYSIRLSTGLKYEIFRAIANDLEVLNHALNFYLYILLSKPIRAVLPTELQNFKSLFSNKTFPAKDESECASRTESCRKESSPQYKVNQDTEVRQREPKDGTKCISERDNRLTTLSQQTNLSETESETTTEKLDENIINDKQDLSDDIKPDSTLNGDTLNELLKNIINNEEIELVTNLPQCFVMGKKKNKETQPTLQNVELNDARTDPNYHDPNDLT